MRYGSRGICVRTALHLDRSLEYVKDDRMNIAGFIKRKFGNRRGLLDYSLFFIVLFLLSFGLVMLYSTSSYEAAAEYGDSAYYLKRQMIFTLFGLVLMTGVSMIPYTLWKKLSSKEAINGNCLSLNSKTQAISFPAFNWLNAENPLIASVAF